MNYVLKITYFLFVYVAFISSVFGQYSANDSLMHLSLFKKAEQLIDSDPKKAFQSAFEAHQIAEAIKNESLLFASKIQLGKLFFYNGLYENATQFFVDALEIAVNENNLEWQGKSYYQLGTIRLILEDYSKALEHFNKAENILNKHYEPSGGLIDNVKINFYNAYGIINTNTQEYESAFRFFNSALELVGENPLYINNKIQILNNLGDLYSKKEQFSEAINNYNKTLQILEQQPNLLYEAMVLISLGKVNVTIDQPKEAINYFSKAYKVASEANGISHLKHITEGLGKSFEKLNVKDSALYYFQISKKYEDTLNLRKTSEKILQEELAINYAIEKRKLSSTFSQKQKVFFVVLGILFLIVISIYLKSRLQKRKLIKLNKENQINTQKVMFSEKENETLKHLVIENQKKMAMASMKNMQKDALIDLIAKKIPQNDASLNSNELEEIQQSLKSIQDHKGLQNFEYQFERLYIGFFEKLQDQFPKLTTNERRLCAFLKLQMNTKEISAVTGQTLRAVEMARIRLRKKLGITKSDTSLNDFFRKY